MVQASCSDQCRQALGCSGRSWGASAWGSAHVRLLNVLGQAHVADMVRAKLGMSSSYDVLLEFDGCELDQVPL